MTKIKIHLFGGLLALAAVLCLGFWFTSSKAEEPKDTSHAYSPVTFSSDGPLTFSADAFPSIGSFETGRTCDEATNSLNAYFTYEQVRKQLDESRPVASIEYINCFWADSDVPDDPLVALEELIGGVFDSNVLYSYLRVAFSRAFVQGEQTDQYHRISAWAAYSFGKTAVEAYDRTGERRFVELYVEYFELLLKLRDVELGYYDDYHGFSMNSWGSNNLKKKRWVAHITHFSVIMGPATSIARRIKADAKLADLDAFADRVVEYFDDAYPEYHSDRRKISKTNQLWYWRPVQNKFEATNHLHLQGEVLLNMYALTGNPSYSIMVDNIIEVFENGVELDDQGLISWNYHPYFQVKQAMSDKNARENSEPTWKAALTIPFLFRAEKDGFEVDNRVMAAIIKTILEHVIVDNDYAITLHPDNGLSNPRPDQEWIFDRYKSETDTITRFLVVTNVNPEISERIRKFVATRRDLLPNGWFSTPQASEGYAFFLDNDN